MRHCLLTATALLLILAGCGGGNTSEKVAKKPNAMQTADPQPKKKAKQTRRRRSRARAPARFRKYQKASDQARKDLPDSAKDDDPDNSKPVGGSAGLSEEVAIERLGTAIVDSVELRPTLVVWLIDATASASRLRERTVSALGQFYSQVNDKLKKKKSSNKLTTAIGAFGKDVQWIVEAPIADGSAIADSLTKLTADSSGQELTFTAIKAAVDKFGSYVKKRHEVMVVVVTDEAGDDGAEADETIQLAKKASVLVYTIGVPSAFGRVSAVMQSVEGVGKAQPKRRGKRSKRPASGKTNIVQGPESRYSEFVNIPFWGNRRGVLIDAGFGPFELERICRVSGGRFIAIRRQSFENAFPATVTDQWPTSNALVCNPETMRRYLPNYVSESRYQKILSGNKAQMAVHKAAKFPIENLPEPLLVFAKARTEAEFNRRLTRAQQLPAIVQPQVERLFSILRQGEADRPKLTSPRWQAAFDLAIGRVLAMKVRIDGYNTLLAAMKRGKKFQNPNSTQWILQGSDKIEGNSSLTKSAARARKYLQSVVSSHPNTPWAQIAQMELETPIGWKWTEQ